MLSAPLRHPSSPRASDLLRNRFREPWSLARLAAATGLSTRTLNRVTRRQSGLSPMALLRRARLAQARLELDAPGPAATVTIVALDCGFTHLGRFSLDYARQFGESPSETLRRARRRQPAA
jgi:transcriptional regulator GlxA family with amidase domain